MADDQKEPTPALPPKLDLSKLSGRTVPKPPEDKPASPEPTAADKPAASPPAMGTPSVSAPPAAPRPGTPPTGGLPKPGVGSGTPGSPSRPSTIRLKPKLPPPRPVSAVHPVAAVNPGTDKPVSPLAPPPGVTASPAEDATESDTGVAAAPATPPAAESVSPATVNPDDTQSSPTTAPTPSKRETSRIPLEAAQPSGPKTIRIRPATKPAAPTPPAATGNDNLQDAKRRTSRISLESALSGTTEEAAGAPKTIRLKRPVPATDKVTLLATDDGKDALSKTAPIVDAATDIPMTQKRTIKVKRPGQASAQSKPTLRRVGSATQTGDSAAADDPAAVAAMVPGVPAVDGAHWTFITLSILTVIIIGVTIYMFSAQVFGPNYSLSPLSYGADTMELPWPGRLYTNP